jgi:hypothetical protein
MGINEILNRQIKQVGYKQEVEWICISLDIAMR